MKKTILILAALLMIGSAAFAGGGFDIAIGPKVGFQTSKLSYNKADIKSGFSNHFTAGVFGRVTVGRLYVQPEVLYFKTSNLFDVNVTGEDEYFNIPTGANVNLTLNQMNLQVPVLIGVNILDLDLLTLRAQVGPTANFVLKSQTLIDYTVSATGNDGSQMTQEGNASSDSDQFNTKTISATWSENAFNLEDFVAHNNTPSTFYPISCEMIKAEWEWNNATKLAPLTYSSNGLLKVQ